MYKHASRNIQRRLKVMEVRPDASTYVCDDDLIQSAGNMSEAECEDERRNLLVDKARCENELVAAKATRDALAIRRLGHRLQTIGARLGMLKKRIHVLSSQRSLDAFHDAAREVLPKTTLQRVYDRQQELIAERRAML
jgi:hypothetical protein